VADATRNTPGVLLATGTQRHVRRPVVATSRDDARVAAGARSGDPDRGHYGLGPGVRVAHLVESGKPAQQDLRMLPFVQVGNAPTATVSHRPRRGLDDLRVSIAMNQTREVAVRVDELAAAIVPDAVALASDCVRSGRSRVVGRSSVTARQER